MSGTELTEEQTQLLSTMNGYEKAAVLMLSLNEEDAAGIFRHLEPKQVQRLGMTMASMSDFSHDKVTAVHRCFINDIQKHSSIGLDASGFIKDVLGRFPFLKIIFKHIFQQIHIFLVGVRLVYLGGQP